MAKGDVVRVVRGNKVPIGTSGVVIWTGTTEYGERLGIKDRDGIVHWTAAKNVEPATAAPRSAAPVADDRVTALETRVAHLEQAMTALMAQLVAPAA